jgi:hypothetical protein
LPEVGLRDLRIDFFRGLAIYMIFVDHVSGDPLAKFTYRMIGLSDAAEIFVFISGLACGIAYSRMFDRGGLAAVISAVLRRAARIYFYYLLCSVASIVLLVAAARRFELVDLYGVATDTPLRAIASAITMTAPPHMSGILVLYIALTVIVVPVFVATRGWHRQLALAVSALIWIACQLFPSAMVVTPTPFLNPLAWQFLFAIGVTIGIERGNGQLSSWPRGMVAAAWTVVIGAFAYRILIAQSGFDISSLRITPDTNDAMKENLSPIRLLHFLSVALLVAVYVPRNLPILKWRIAQPAIIVGRHSLEIFSLSIVLTTMANIFVHIGAPSLTIRLVADALVFACLALTAVFLAHHRLAKVSRV